MNNGLEHRQKRIEWLAERIDLFRKAMRGGEPERRYLVRLMKMNGLFSPSYSISDAVLSLPRYEYEVEQWGEYVRNGKMSRRLRKVSANTLGILSGV